MQKLSFAVAVLALLAVSCSSAGESSGSGGSAADLASLPRGEAVDFGPAPVSPDGEYSAQTAAAIDILFGSGTVSPNFDEAEREAIAELGASEDPRVAWILMDLLRFAQDATRATDVTNATNQVTGLDASGLSAWGEVTDSLIAWDIPAPPNYVETKQTIYASILPEWRPLFEDTNETMDWRYVSWGGVRIDDRAFDMTDEPCNCIPAADNPLTQPAAEATWLDPEDVVFGVVINDEARAYPRQIMEVREMVNDTLGGRDFAMPYCTLCGAAQVWFTDDLPDGIERPVFRTSGLLNRSNKVMYELNTFSVFDTFLGNAQTGPLANQEIQLNQHTVITTSWADWVEAHPETDVLVESLALGRDFDFRNGRDSDGPIFPIGSVDPRLDVQEDVLGVIKADGTPLAFHVDTALAVLERGDTVEVDGISVIQDGGGIRAIDSDGNDIAGHQAFWFAWSQFNEGTELWPS